jgi:acyl-CoA reductase-like NAD-dependent aldehyde dehydrogenase
VVDQLVKPSISPLARDTAKVVTAASSPVMAGCFLDIESAIFSAEKAFYDYQKISNEQRKKMIASIRARCLENLEALARLALEETGLGRYEDKLKKNEVAIVKTPGVEDLEPIAYSGDGGLTILERAPYGLIGAITPSTNPSETIINNTIGMIAGGNAVVFNPHPSAKKVSAFTVDLINQAIISEGGPANLITTVMTPTIDSAQVVMKHPLVKLLVVTGGPAVVAAAMKSGKKVIAAGPGNPPVVVDETADIEKAAKDIVMSASMDNNIICVIEKNIIATKLAATSLKKALVQNGAVELTRHQAQQLEAIIVDGDHPHKNWVGKDIQLILKQIGLEVDASKRLAFAEVGADHPFAQIELLLPVLPFICVDTFEEAMEVAYQLEGRRFHTAVIHSKNIDHLHRMAVKMNTSIFVKNGPALAGLGLGGEGPVSFTIASPTGEGVTTAKNFTRVRRCVLSGYFRIT